MASPASSAPGSSLRVDVTPRQSSSAGDAHHSRNVTPSPAIRSSSSSDLRQLSNSSTRRGRARYRSPAEYEAVTPASTGTMNRKFHSSSPKLNCTDTIIVKLLTCHWWRTTGHCRHSAADCLYAHHDTGRYADAPRQVAPGQPAVAGRNADRRLREVENQNSSSSLRLENIQTNHRSSNSLANLNQNSLAPDTHPFSAPPGGSFNLSAQSSRPSTPGGLMMRSPLPNAFSMGPNSSMDASVANVQQLENEVSFFRTLVEQAGREKEVMVSTIEILQAENQSLKASFQSAQNETRHLTEERDALRAALTILQQQTESRSSTQLSMLRRTTTSSSWADFGTIGARRFGSGGSGATGNGNAADGGN